MRAILVSVDFTDLLNITLPYNQHHFEEVVVVTSNADLANVCKVTNRFPHVRTFATDLFYERGADFNKWAALEAGLDFMGREGWLCLMDVDVLWPKQVLTDQMDPTRLTDYPLSRGYLYTPRRRMWENWPTHQVTNWNEESWQMLENGSKVPSEQMWDKFPLHPQQIEFAGYTQIFHASDPALGLPPWHETDWRHCGGADSFFQAKWSLEKKIRPPFEVLHLGKAGENWCGRSSTRLDGTTPPEASMRRQKVYEYIRSRVPGPRGFRREKLL